MCTRFIFRGNDVITGCNFDIDCAEWNHKRHIEKVRFYLGNLQPDGRRHSYHGVNKNGNVGTLLYVHGNPKGAYRNSPDCLSIADITEQFIQGKRSFDDILQLLQEKNIVYAPDATMQACLSDQYGRSLIIEPGIGWREEHLGTTLITNYSLLNPASTSPYIVAGDNRYERAQAQLAQYDEHFSVSDAFDVLQEVKQEGLWATRVSFVYTANENTVYYTENNRFDCLSAFTFH